MLDMGFAEDIEAILDGDARRAPDGALLGHACRRASPRIAKRHLTRPGAHPDRREARAPPARRRTCARRAYVVPRAAQAGRARPRPRRRGARPRRSSSAARATEVDELTETLNGRGYRAEALHGGMTQEQRDRVMSAAARRHGRPARRHRRRRPRPRHRAAHARRQLRRARRRPRPTCTASAASAAPGARASRSRSPSRASTGMLRNIERRHQASRSRSRRCRPSPTCAPGASS